MTQESFTISQSTIQAAFVSLDSITTGVEQVISLPSATSNKKKVKNTAAFDLYLLIVKSFIFEPHQKEKQSSGFPTRSDTNRAVRLAA